MRWPGGVLLAVVMSAAGAGEAVRPAAVAGSWYPGDAQQLAAYLDRLLEAGPPAEESGGGRIRALIAPHAGYRYSGATAGRGYRLLRGADYDRVLVLGPAHRGWFRGLSIADVAAYETPLGRIPLDVDTAAALRRSELIGADPRAHDREHSIEMQLPFLQRVLQPGWRLLPVLVGDMGGGDYATAADLLRPLLRDGRTLVVVSSDFTHYGPRFGYLPFPRDDEVAGNLEALDKGALESILARDPAALLDYQRRTGITVCGYRPIVLLLHLLPEGVQGRLLSYATSGQLTGDYENSVSYLTILFREAGVAKVSAGAGALSEGDMQWLHTLASTAVEAAARAQDPVPMERLQRLLEGVPDALESPSGAFVTLKRHGRLRGCIGYILPRSPLYQAVAENGVNAAVRDRRFAPLGADELEGLEVEVSVLTPPRPIDGYRSFRVGEEGIILEKGGRSAVFLPEVAVEQGWDREQTLTHLARKAGLAADAWKEGARFETFRSQKYAAPYAPARD